jgi:hypothetical protein
MADIRKLYQYHEAADVILLLARASTLAKERPEIKIYDFQTELKVGFEEASIIYDWIADQYDTEAFISDYRIRSGRRYVRNNPFPSLSDMADKLKLGERRTFLIMQALEKKGIIKIKEDFSFERVGRMASFDDLVEQMKWVGHKYRGRCEPSLLMRLMFLDQVTALRLAQYGEEHLGLIWKNRPKNWL